MRLSENIRCTTESILKKPHIFGEDRDSLKTNVSYVGGQFFPHSSHNNFPWRALSLESDVTIFPFAPVIARLS